MRHIRQTIGHQLVDMLHECNLADFTDEDGTITPNDINTKCSHDHEAYGHIGDALTSMGFNRAREVYASEGSVDAAKAEIDAQYKWIEKVAS